METITYPPKLSGLLVLAGMPCAGKSTSAMLYPASAVVSWDTCAWMVGGNRCSYQADTLFWTWVEQRLSLQRPTVIDRTCLTLPTRHRLLTMARHYDLRASCVLVDTSLAEARQRNAKRFHPLPDRDLVACERKARHAREMIAAERWDASYLLSTGGQSC